MSRPSRSRAIAIANPSLSREQLARVRKRERLAEEQRQTQLQRQDDAIPTARKVGRDYPGGASWEWRTPRSAPDLHHDEEYVLNGTRTYRQSPTVGVGRSGPGKGDAIGAEKAIGVFAGLERVAAKAQIPREMVDAIGMQLGGCSVEEIAESLGVTRGTVKGYLERGKKRMAAIVAEGGGE